MSTQLSEPTIECSTFVDLLHWRATQQPARRAYTFLSGGESDEVHLTYGELDRLARAIGALLQAQDMSGQRALLLYPPGIEYIAAFLGCLYAGVIAVPVYPPNPVRLDRTLPRLRSIVLDACPAVVLTTTPIHSLAGALAAHDPAFQRLRWLATDALVGDRAADWRDPEVQGDTLAFLQYTSGSTSTPKGVMVSHGNLLRNEALIQRAFELTKESLLVGWLPLYHDMGLIGNVLQPLYTGFPCVLMSPVDFLQHPFRWLQAISRYRATISGGPNFAYDLCVRKITPEQRATLDLRSWSVAFNGAEPIRCETLKRFGATFAACGFRAESLFPCYGLAEATLFVSGGPKSAPPVLHPVLGAALERNQIVPASAGDPDARTIVGCGQTWPEQQIAIVDPESRRRCAPDQVGEIWILGPSVTLGYWNQPEATEQTFQAYLADTAEGPFLRTGDTGFLAADGHVEEGELIVTGRIKDMILMDGRNLYPQDIELAVEQSHTAIRPGCCAAFSVDIDGQERLIVVAEVDRGYCRMEAHSVAPAASADSLDLQEVYRVIRRAITAAHDVQTHDIVLLKTGSIPKTSSGKLQRHACRTGYLAGRLYRWDR
jgi:acyl-CoA synthetase (AMP-forming)/AMP-acid ligase II